MTPTTVKSDSPGMKVSVIEGAPSKNVCSGTSCCAAAAEGGPFCFGPFSLIFFRFVGEFFDGCGL
jgi:hypothetical protein